MKEKYSGREDGSQQKKDPKFIVPEAKSSFTCQKEEGCVAFIFQLHPRSLCKPGKEALRAGTVLRVFEVSVLEDYVKNSITHTNLLEEISLISNAVGNKLLAATAKDKTLQKAVNTVTERRLGNYISIQIRAFCN